MWSRPYKFDDTKRRAKARDPSLPLGRVADRGVLAGSWAGVSVLGGSSAEESVGCTRGSGSDALRKAQDGAGAALRVTEGLAVFRTKRDVPLCSLQVTGMTYVDFLEGLGRVAEIVSPPSVLELRRQNYNSDHPTYEYYFKVWNLWPPVASSGHLQLCSEQGSGSPWRRPSMPAPDITETLLRFHGAQDLFAAPGTVLGVLGRAIDWPS